MRVPSIKIALADDISVVVKGEAIDMSQGIEALKNALKAMMKARDTGLDAKTAQAVCAIPPRRVRQVGSIPFRSQI